MRCTEAWHDLSTERPVGFAVGAIPVSKIWGWCDRKGLDHEAADILTHVIRKLDADQSRAAARKAELDAATGKGAKR